MRLCVLMPNKRPHLENGAPEKWFHEHEVDKMVSLLMLLFEHFHLNACFTGDFGDTDCFYNTLILFRVVLGSIEHFDSSFIVVALT